MLTRIATKNYRNLHIEPGVQLDRLAIFVGPNGSGKSNLVRVLTFLQDALTGSPDERRGINSFEDAIARLGSGRILDAKLEMPAVVSFRLLYSLQDDKQDGFYLDLDVKGENTVTVHRELMYRNPPPGNRQFYYIAHSPSMGTGSLAFAQAGKHQGLKMRNVPTNKLAFIAFSGALERYLENKAGSQSSDNNSGQRQNEQVQPQPGKTSDISISMPVLDQEDANNPQGSPSKAPEDEMAEPVTFYDGRERMLDYVSGWTFYESARMNLDQIRRSKPELGTTDRILHPSGDNLPVVLFNLMREDLDFADQMADAMRELFPRTRALRVLPVGRLTLSIEWHMQDIKKPFYLDEMSDGTVRMLCWAVVLLSPKLPTLIVLDEPEAGIHPAWLRVLAGWIRNAARRTQVIVSTHSPDLLDYFTENISNVHVFRPDPQNPEYNVVTPLDVKALEPKLEAGWQLGDLYRTGDPTVGGWPW